jgi:hypothetical protein
MLTAANKQKRAEFAVKYQAKSVTWWRKVTFSDSKYFGIGAAGRLYAYIFHTEGLIGFSGVTLLHPYPRTPRESSRVHVYSALNVKCGSHSQ